jgi:small subunit ribosomal protein S1
MKKGQIVEVVILDIDKANRRISLGHKQIFEDPWTTLEQRFAVGMLTRGTIIRILDRGVVAALDENDIEGFVPAFQLGQDIKKPSEAFEVGDELPLKVIEFDKDQRKVVLSVREYFKDKDKAELEEFRQKHQPKPVTLGDTFGAILGDQKTSPAPAEASNPDAAEEKAPEPLQSVENAEKREEEATENPGA